MAAIGSSLIALDLSYAAAGALTGFVIGITGVGGGALMTPLLLLFGINPVTAVATDLWFAALTKLAGARVHWRSGNIDWQVVRRLWLGSLPAAAVMIVVVSSGWLVSRSEWLTKVIGAIVLLTAVGLLFSPDLLRKGLASRLGDPHRFKSSQKGLTVAAGGMLGVLVSATSIGAGALGSAILLYLYPLRMTPPRLVATDIVHAIPLAIVSGFAYLLAGWVNFDILASLLIGSIPAILLGSFLSGRLPQKAMRIALASILALSGLKAMA